MIQPIELIITSTAALVFFAIAYGIAIALIKWQDKKYDNKKND